MNGVVLSVVAELSDVLRSELTTCWLDVANAGGPVGFPFIPVLRAPVAEAVADLEEEIDSGDVVLFQARLGESLAGWVILRLNRSRLTAHWATVERSQSHPSCRGAGVGDALLEFVTEHARNIGLEQLKLVVRSGEGLESFYQRRGWLESGRHQNALRLAEDDDRDEVFMSIRVQAV